MNKKLAIFLGTLLVLPSAITHATGAGGYIGLGLGQSNTHNVDESMLATAESVHPAIFETVKPSNTGVGGKIFGGYYFNPYIGLEAGATYYSPSNYETNIAPSCAKNSIDTYSLDLAGKAMMPIGKFGAFLKGGVALIYASGFSGFGNSTIVDGCSTNKASQTTVRPEYGVGVSYDFTPSIVFDVSWTQVNGNGGNGKSSGSGTGSNKIQNADLIALSLSYHFVDVYCGQFLC